MDNQTMITDFLTWAHLHGYAVAVFSQTELQNTLYEAAEDAMISAGWQRIQEDGGRIADVIYVDGAETLEEDL